MTEHQKINVVRSVKLVLGGIFASGGYQLCAHFNLSLVNSYCVGLVFGGLVIPGLSLICDEFIHVFLSNEVVDDEETFP